MPYYHNTTSIIITNSYYYYIYRLTKAFVHKNNCMTAARLLSIKGGANNLPSSEDMKPFYALGVNIAKQIGGELKGSLTKDELQIVVDGFADSMKDLVSDDRTLLMTYGSKINEILNDRLKKQIDQEKKKGSEFATKFLLGNPKAIRTSSGLIFSEILAGVGAQPNLGSTVLVHYHGTLSDGTVFDSSVDRGEPIKFPLKNVILGWQEGVAMMKAGGKCTLIIPSDIAYGDNGSPPVIPPGATLRFEVELLSVV